MPSTFIKSEQFETELQMNVASYTEVDNDFDLGSIVDNAHCNAGQTVVDLGLDFDTNEGKEKYGEMFFGTFDMYHDTEGAAMGVEIFEAIKAIRAKY